MALFECFRCPIFRSSFEANPPSKVRCRRCRLSLYSTVSHALRALYLYLFHVQPVLRLSRPVVPSDNSTAVFPFVRHLQSSSTSIISKPAPSSPSQPHPYESALLLSFLNLHLSPLSPKPFNILSHHLIPTPSAHHSPGSQSSRIPRSTRLTSLPPKSLRHRPPWHP